MRHCPTSTELLQLLDGELTENRASQLRNHLAGCTPCRAELGQQRQLIEDIRAPQPGIPSSSLMARVVRGIDEARVRPASRYWAPALALAATVACLALVTLQLVQRPGPGDEAAFRARKGAGVGTSRHVGLTLLRADRGMKRVDSGARVEPDAAYVLAYTNLKESEPRYLLSFAVDSAHTVHWLYPAYLDPEQDPPALELAMTREERTLAESVVLERPALGPLRFVSIVSAARERVSSIERLSPAQLRTSELQARFGAAMVSEISVEVVGTP